MNGWSLIIEGKDKEIARLRGLLREALDALPTRSDYEYRAQYLRDLRTRIDAALTTDQPAVKDWHCSECGLDFQSDRKVCPRCHPDGVICYPSATQLAADKPSGEDR